MFRSRFFPSVLVLMMATIAGCWNSTDSSGRIRVLATTSIIADGVKEIGGEHVFVEALMGPGLDPHRYSPSASDLARLSEAQIIFYNGLHLEGKMHDLLAKNPEKNFAVASALPTDQLLLAEEHNSEGVYDPHLWFDVILWSQCLQVVRDELSRLDPAHANDYEKNYNQYQKRLEALHQELRQKIEKIPPSRRILVTAHDAFRYLGKRYGLTVRGLQGVSTAAESGSQDVGSLAQLIGDRRIPAVFTETTVPSKGLKSVLDRVRKVYSLEVKLIAGEDALYSDALGAPGSSGETYIKMLQHNFSTITQALK